jgi:hypothetical protein
MSFAKVHWNWMTKLVPIGCALLLGCSGGQKKQDQQPVAQPAPAPAPAPTQPPPVDNGKPIDVKLRLDAISASKGAFEMQPGDVLKSGDRMAINVLVDQPAYVYVTMISGDGTSQRLLPKSGDLQVTPTEPLRYPKNPEKWMTLDKNIGQENVFVYAAKRPLLPEEQLNMLNADVATVKAAAAKRASKPKSAAKPKDAPAHLTADSRGVTLDDDDDQGAAASSTEANGIIKKRFMLQHK